MEQIIKQINEAGFWIANLFQLDSGLWRANIFKTTPFGRESWEFAEGVTATEALEAAWHYSKVKNATKTLPKPQYKTLPKTLDLDSVLEGL